MKYSFIIIPSDYLKVVNENNLYTNGLQGKGQKSIENRILDVFKKNTIVQRHNDKNDQSKDV